MANQVWARENWSIGIKTEDYDVFCFVFSITPLLYHSIIPKNTEITGITNPLWD